MDYSQLIAVLLDVALGALAYRLAMQVRKETRAVAATVERHTTVLKKAGLLD